MTSTRTRYRQKHGMKTHPPSKGKIGITMQIEKRLYREYPADETTVDMIVNKQINPFFQDMVRDLENGVYSSIYPDYAIVDDQNKTLVGWGS